MADQRYLKQRHQAWFFALSVPRDLREKVGRDRIVVSLQTRDLGKAQQLRWARLTEYQSYFDHLRNDTPLSRAQIDAHALELYRATLAKLESDARRGKRLTASPTSEGDDRNPEIIGLDLVADDYAEAIEAGNFSSVASDLAAVERRTGVKIEPGSTTYDLLAYALLEAKRAALAGRIAGLQGQDVVPPVFVPPAVDLATLTPVEAAPRPKPVRRKGGAAFADAAARLIAERQRDPSTQLTEQTRGQYEAAHRLFDSWAGSPTLEEIDRRRAGEFLDRVASLDPNWGRSPGVKELSFGKIFESFGKHKPGLSNRTVNRYAMALGMVWQFAQDRDGLEIANPWTRQMRKTAGTRGNAETKKRPFKNAEVRKLLALKPTMEIDKHTPATALPWLILIGAYSGMRANEIAELECADIQKHSGVWVFDVTEAKSEAGVRVVPVHSRIIAAGFLDYRKRIGKGSLFPGLTPQGPDGKRWWYPSKRFTELRRDLKLTDLDPVTNRDRLDFHSLRRSFITVLRHAGVSKEDVAEIVGHEDPSETFGTYAGKQRITRLAEIVERVRYNGD